MGHETYQLCSGAFRARTRGGTLISLRPGPAVGGQEATEYVMPGDSFGRFFLSWKVGKEADRLRSGPDCPPLWENLERSPLLLQYEACWQKEGSPLKARAVYTLKEGCLFYELFAENTGSEALTLDEAGFAFPCNSAFRWGEPAGDKVIGHHFVSGHGSHFLFERCDGKGPLLAVLPQEGIRLEYYSKTPNCASAETADERGTDVFTAYALSAGIRPTPEKMGARLMLPATSKQLQPGEQAHFCLRYEFAENLEEARKLFIRRGLVDVQVFPGMTVPMEETVSLLLSSCWKDLKACPVDGVEILTEEHREQGIFLQLRLNRPGEIPLRVEFAGDREMYVTFFATLPIKELLEKRASFLLKCQHMDSEKWYDGLISEWNNETGVLLGPDNYDRIGGWRIYEVSCDDPGLAKPAFLSSKAAEIPEPEQVRALDRYVERFVWGGLQCTEEEKYPYGIYGIPDWKTNRESSDPDLRGRLHIWRIYDYSHIALLYYNLYRIARNNPEMPLSQSAETYLHRASATACAMFTIPLELDGWSAYKTGLYNEVVIEDILTALQEEGMEEERMRLERHWDRKMRYFVLECTDVFGSEYPFDTTGFESTQALAGRAVKKAEEKERENVFTPPLSLEKAETFLHRQIRCNRACRGELEPAYYWYGSDYRGSNIRYTLSYMSQMGGWALLNYALYFAIDPYPLLRLACGSLLSSWALLNAGHEEDGFGYWFPGSQHDGAACGGFEPLPYGETWLDQPHHGGPWYYSCEIDLGFCGYLRGAASILIQDPLMGVVCFGAKICRENGLALLPEDGVERRFHYVGPEGRVHVLLSEGKIASVSCDKMEKKLSFQIDLQSIRRKTVWLRVETEGLSGWVLKIGQNGIQEGAQRVEAKLPSGGSVAAQLCF